MKLFVGIQDLGVPFIGIIYFGAPLSLHSDDVSFRVTSYLGFPLEELTHSSYLRLYFVLEGLKSILGAPIYGARPDYVCEIIHGILFYWFPKYVKMNLFDTVSYLYCA